MGSVEVSVVVASHARHLRLLWLLNALEQQTLPRTRWEVVVVHDYDRATADRVIESHPLRRAELLRQIAIPPGSGSPARQRNLGWRAANGPLVAFTDDDCRPEPEWLERLVSAAEREQSEIVQGSTYPDPLESGLFAAPHIRSMFIEPVGPYAQTCNILYGRSLLERVGGFDERAVTGEDVDLSLRARADGYRIAGAPDATVYHAVESHTLPGILRHNLKWRYLAYLTSRHPELRREFRLGVFWDSEHMYTTVALVGLLGSRWRRALLTLALPYALRGSRRRGPGLRARAVSVAELPGQAVRQGAEVAGMLAGSVRHRTLVL